jgi:hypothetical protein
MKAGRWAHLIRGFIMAAFALNALPAQAGAVVVPNANETVDGNNTLSGCGGCRWQQVYAASQFAGLGAITISQIAFRPDTDFVGVIAPITDHGVRFDLSTTAAAPNALNPVFAANVGADDTIVFSGDWTRSSANVAGPGNTKAFDIVLVLTTTFTYDPSLGNLLLDIRSPNQADTLFPPTFDTVDGSAVTSQRYGGTAFPTGIELEPGFGVVTQFTYASALAAAPEPGSMALFAVTAAAFLLARRAPRLRPALRAICRDMT